MIVSILVAFLIFGVLASFYRAFNAGEEAAAADRLVVVNKINFTQPCRSPISTACAASRACARSTHSNWFGGYYQDPKNFLIAIAVEPETYLDVYANELRDRARGEAGVRARAHRCAGGRAPGAGPGGGRSATAFPISSNIFSQKNGSRTWDFTIVGIVGGAQAAGRHQFHGVPVRVFRRDALVRQGPDRLDGAADDVAVAERDGGQGDRPDVRQLHRRDLDRYREGVQQGVRRAARQYRVDRRAGGRAPRSSPS